jgi:MFS family permease
MTLGRVLGDRLTDGWGSWVVIRAGAAVAVLGMGSALLWPTVPGTLAAFAACGLGAAPAIPAAVSRAAATAAATSTGVMVISMMQRLGPMLAALVIGLVAEHAGLRAALVIVPAAAVVLWVGARALAGTAAIRGAASPEVAAPAGWLSKQEIPDP